jgi:hypothetical protein
MRVWFAKQWAGASSRLRLLGALFYLLLLLFVVWYLAGAGFRLSEFFKSSTASLEDVRQLDSFSQPCIAAAILKQESDQLFAAYLRDRPQGPDIPLPQSQPQIANQISEPPPTGGAQARDPLRKSQTIERLADLQRKVDGLDGDLDRKLLMVYYENCLWNEFLDRYLHLAQAEPRSVAVLSWAWIALACSLSCHRTGEVTDQLEHLARFHPELKTVRGLKKTLEDWRAAHPPGSMDIGRQAASIEDSRRPAVTPR